MGRKKTRSNSSTRTRKNITTRT